MRGSSLALGSEQETSRVCPRAWDRLSLFLVGLEPGGCSLGLGQVSPLWLLHRAEPRTEPGAGERDLERARAPSCPECSGLH